MNTGNRRVATASFSKEVEIENRAQEPPLPAPTQDKVRQVTWAERGWLEAKALSIGRQPFSVRLGVRHRHDRELREGSSSRAAMRHGTRDPRAEGGSVRQDVVSDWCS